MDYLGAVQHGFTNMKPWNVAVFVELGLTLGFYASALPLSSISALNFLLFGLCFETGFLCVTLAVLELTL